MTSLTKQCYVLFEIHFSGSLIEANRSNRHSKDLRSHSRAIMALDHSRLGLENKFWENKSGRIFLRLTGLLYKFLPANLGILYFADWTGLDWTCKTRTSKTQTSKTRTSKTRTSKTRTCKTRTSKTRTCKTRTSKTRTGKTRTSKTRTGKTRTGKTRTCKTQKKCWLY